MQIDSFRKLTFKKPICVFSKTKLHIFLELLSIKQYLLN